MLGLLCVCGALLGALAARCAACSSLHEAAFRVLGCAPNAFRVCGGFSAEASGRGLGLDRLGAGSRDVEEIALLLGIAFAGVVVGWAS